MYRYEGEWKDNKKTGWGRMTWRNGGFFRGQWVDNSKEGYGYQQVADSFSPFSSILQYPHSLFSSCLDAVLTHIFSVQWGAGTKWTGDT